jgi:hypothetical protein
MAVLGVRVSPVNEQQMHRNGALLALAVFLYHSTTVSSTGIKWFIWLTLWYTTGGKYWLYLFRNTIKRDAR